MMPSAARSLRLAALALLSVAAIACHRDGVAPNVTHPALTSADRTRPRLLARLVVPSLDRTVATVDDLHGRGALPFSGTDVRAMLLARLSLPSSALDLVDTGRPISLAFLAPAGASAPGAPPTVTGAFSLRGASSVAGVLGAPMATVKQAQEIRGSDGRSFWVLPVGEAVLWADSFEALADGGPHALAARTDSADDLVFTAYPPAYAHAQGFDPAAGAAPWTARLLAGYEEQLGARGRRFPAAERASLDAFLTFALTPIAESSSIDLAVGLGRESGLEARLQAHPQAGTGFATRLMQRAPAQPLPGVLAAPGLVSVGAVGASPSLLRLAQQSLEAEARVDVPGAAQVAARLQPLLALTTGALYTGMHDAGRALAADLSIELVPGARPGAAIDALAALLSDPALSLLLRQTTGSAPAISLQRAADDLHAEIAFPGDSRPGTPSAVARAAFGASTVSLTARAAGGRLSIVTEPGGADRLSALASPGAPGAPEGALATALAETHGRAAFFYVDAWALARPLLPGLLGGAEGRLVGGLLAIPGLARLDLPFWMSVDDGAQLAADLRVPLSTLANAASMLALFGGASAGP